MTLEEADKLWWDNMKSPISAISQIAILPLPPSEYVYTKDIQDSMKKLVFRSFDDT